MNITKSVMGGGGGGGGGLIHYKIVIHAAHAL